MHDMGQWRNSYSSSTLSHRSTPPRTWT